MTRRILAAVAALVLAVLGAVLLARYVGAADERAMAGLETTTVLVAAEPVPEGTPAAELPLTAKTLPRSAVTPGALTSLEEVAGMVTTAELQAGEQVLAARFADPAALADPTRAEVPEGMQELSLLLEPQRVVGGQVLPGDTVGVFVSSNGKTHLVLHKVLVTRVQGGVVPVQPTAGEEPAPAAAPAGGVMVTLALAAPDAERVVWAQENGAVYLSLQPEAAAEGGTTVVTEGSVLP